MVFRTTIQTMSNMLASYKKVIPCLEIRGKSRGSVRESGDSVERLEECSGARACTFGELGARACSWSAREARGRRQAPGRGAGRAGVSAGGTRVQTVHPRVTIFHPKCTK
ncbi:hypothetical protein CRG98_007333 [Punica granatum]|uniref:Uncharacterized protein n=1 Tax=Punica granatum TaxID=22663 RepID=A0A2I0KUV8_PUNGR|nr:hypothetical protein CRG98_007333 [Punica granatum]